MILAGTFVFKNRRKTPGTFLRNEGCRDGMSSSADDRSLGPLRCFADIPSDGFSVAF